MTDRKTCVKCGQARPFKDFPHRKQVRQGRKAVCTNCSTIVRTPGHIREAGRRTMIKYRLTMRGQYRNFFQTMVRRGKKFDLTFEEFSQLIGAANNKCFYCGIEMNRKQGSRTGRSIDRKDNNKVYTLKNVVVCCRRCNTIKSDVFSADEMIEIAERYIKPKLRTF